jgi:hypothetical protein
LIFETKEVRSEDEKKRENIIFDFYNEADYAHSLLLGLGRTTRPNDSHHLQVVGALQSTYNFDT